MKKLIPLVSILGLVFAPLRDILNEAPFQNPKLTQWLKPSDHYQLSCTSKGGSKATIPAYYAQITGISDKPSESCCFNEFYYYNSVIIKVSLPSNSCEIQLPLSIENNLKAGQYIDPKTIADIMFHNQFECVLKLHPYRKHYDVDGANSDQISDSASWIFSITCKLDNSSAPKAKFEKFIGEIIKLDEKLYQNPIFKNCSKVIYY